MSILERSLVGLERLASEQEENVYSVLYVVCILSKPLIVMQQSLCLAQCFRVLYELRVLLAGRSVLVYHHTRDTSSSRLCSFFAHPRKSSRSSLEPVLSYRSVAVSLTKSCAYSCRYLTLFARPPVVFCSSPAAACLRRVWLTALLTCGLVISGTR